MDKPGLILRPTVIAGESATNDFSVFFDKRRVGRIRLTAGAPRTRCELGVGDKPAAADSVGVRRLRA
jgi:hypothetical protein